MDPRAAFLASPEYYAQETRATTLLYTMGMPELFPDRTYAWRVRAISTTGIDENAVFKNDGYSEIYHFSASRHCPPPTFALSENVNATTVRIRWQGSLEHTRYHVQYRKAGVADAEWFELSTYNQQAQISNLEAGTTYDFRVGGSCNALTVLDPNFTYGGVAQFSVPLQIGESEYQCGILPEIQITNTDPLEHIGVNETFTAGDFPVTVQSIEGKNGRFTGQGFIVVPYLAYTKIVVEFNGIQINTDYQLIDGEVVTTYDPDWGGVVDIGDGLEGFEDLVSEIEGAIDELFESGQISEEERDAEKGELAELQSSVEAAAGELDTATENLESIQESGGEEEIATAEKEVAEKEYSVSEATQALEKYGNEIRAKNGEDTSIADDDYFDGVIKFEDTSENLSNVPLDNNRGSTIDLSGIFEDDAAKRQSSISASIGTNKTLYITNSFADAQEISRIRGLMASPGIDQYHLWQHYDLEAKEMKYKIAFGTGFFGNGIMDHSGYVEIFNDILTFNIKEFIGVEVVRLSEQMDYLIATYKDNPYLQAELFEGYTIYDLLKFFATFAKQCGEDFAEQQEGIVPECLWDQESFVAAAYYAGFIDGAWETLEGVVDLVKFGGAWSLGNPIFYTEEGSRIRRETIAVVTMIGELWESGEKRSEACTHIMDTFSDYVDNISSFDAQGRYLQGKLIFDIAGLFVGITEIKAFIKTGQLTSSTLQGLQKLAKGGKKLVWALGKNIEVDKNKVVTYLLAANMKLEIAKFGDDGVLIIDDLIRDNTAVVLENIGEVP
ncbi:MAG: fibronectin type III domain-containing protein, partial [Flavobacteriaceae bacterium]